MADAGIETSVHYPYVLPAFRWLPDADCPNARVAAETVVSLPVHEHLTGDEIARVAETARKAVEVCVRG